MFFEIFRRKIEKNCKSIRKKSLKIFERVSFLGKKIELKSVGGRDQAGMQQLILLQFLGQRQLHNSRLRPRASLKLASGWAAAQLVDLVSHLCTVVPNARNSPKIISVGVILQGFQPDSISVNCMRFIFKLNSQNNYKYNYNQSISRIFESYFWRVFAILPSCALSENQRAL